MMAKGLVPQRGMVKENGGSIGELVTHGYSKNDKEAAYSAITAGSDMDMESNTYRNNLAQLVKEKKVP
ncbi:MAG: hypothetical protein EBU33_09445, partial [Sphingobacteriia bacterium]|nr:hypothetical protein [Sphingobacteriia bacterium]